MSTSLLKQQLQAYEKTLIEGYLQDNGGNRSKTAIQIGISRRGLLNKIKNYGIVITSQDPAEQELDQEPSTEETGAEAHS